MDAVKNKVVFKGKRLALLGNELKVGDKAPRFNLIDHKLNEVSSDDFKGKTKVLSVTPSLDTPVCDSQARRFNEEASKLPENVVIMNISMDLPFAISRFCAAAGIDRIKTLSDHRDASFGLGYGVLIKELRLLARSVFVVDSSDTLRYLEIVKEITDHPNYEKALDAVRRLVMVPA